MKNNRFAILILIILSAIAISLAILGPMVLRHREAKIEQSEVKNTLITAKGLVECEEKLEVSSQVPSIITKISVKEGDQVKIGDLLVKLDDSKTLTRVKFAESMLMEAKARLRELEAGYRFEDIDMAKSKVNRADAIYEKAKDEYERQKRLYEKDATTLVQLTKAEEQSKVTTAELNELKINLQKLQRGVRKEEIEQAKSMVEKAHSELTYYQTLLRDYMISSPINGVVTERFKDANETVDTGTPILKLINPNKLRIRAELEETDVGKVQEGQPVEITTDAYKDKIYRGTVYKVLPAVKRKSQKTFDPMASFDINTQDIYIRLDNFSGLKNSMSVTVRFMK